MALYGTTFANQLVSAVDHAVLQARLLSDGILDGMAMTASGSALTIAPGHMIAAGRVIGNDAALAVAVAATSGYARVTLVIDLSGTATAETFNQLSIRVDTADSPASFPALVQEDINDGVHTTYEAALAVLALNASGIASVESAMGRAALSIKYGTAAPTAADIAPGAIYLQLEV